jgi:hypothetical protein
MNPLLQVKFRFNKEKNNAGFGPTNLRSNMSVSFPKIDELSESLRAVLRYYRNEPKILNNLLVDVCYNDIIAKTKRIEEILKPIGATTNDTVVGARFSDAPDGEENHIITHYVDVKTINRTLKELASVKQFIIGELNGRASTKNFNETKKPNDEVKDKLRKENYEKYGLSKSKMRRLIVDCSVVETFSVPRISTSSLKNDTFLVTFYKTELALSSLMEKLNVDDMKYRYSFYGEDTLAVTRDLFDYLNSKVPYLISMISSDLAQVTYDSIDKKTPPERIEIPEPQNEPTIGVIDTLFDESVYFSNWVENTDYLDNVEKMGINDDSREHGTEVTSIIVDGPRMNPWLDDGCGRFRVRHFGVCVDKISTARLVRRLKNIINSNPDIHVWNLSLGTDEEVSKNFISFDAAILDELQAKKNIAFIVSGTNDNRKNPSDRIRVGSPADSLNSIVVNSVKRDGSPVSYSRKGTVLSFFNKPDVVYYGGDYNERINAYSPHGEVQVYGTSFAAPWISRKMCFLIDVMGFSREVAKALIIDSAAGWEYKTSTVRNKELLGYGIVPIEIEKVLYTDNDEIKFVIYGTSESYRMANYGIPVPKDNDDKYPYIARATICYFPECSRSQGVDYTNRELSLMFGRITSDGRIDDINENVQDEEHSYVDERASRKEFRKWENTKFISKLLKRNRALKSYEDRLWGITITSKERLTTQMRDGLNFGAVITLKEIKGVNRIEDFIRMCTIRGWIVNKINIENQIDIYNLNQEELTFK